MEEASYVLRYLLCWMHLGPIILLTFHTKPNIIANYYVCELLCTKDCKFEIRIGSEE